MLKSGCLCEGLGAVLMYLLWRQVSKAAYVSAAHMLTLTLSPLCASSPFRTRLDAVLRRTEGFLLHYIHWYYQIAR